MEIKELKVTIGEVYEGYFNDAEEGVVGYDDRLDIRPKYQREFVYKDKQRDEVIRTVMKGLPLNVIYWCKVKKEDGFVKWDCAAERIVNMLSAYASWPCVFAKIPARNGKIKVIKITKAKSIELNCRGSQPGDILAFGKEGILVACREGALRIEELIPIGGKGLMTASDYLRGSPIPPDCPRMCDFASGD